MRVEVLGVHPVPVPDEVRTAAWEERNRIQQNNELALASAITSFERELGSIFLLEVVVHQAGQPFDLGRFCQFNPSLPEASQQAPYMDVLLAPDGSKSLMAGGQAFRIVPELLNRTMRLAFFLHFFDPNQPLGTPWGEVALPRATPIPSRLAFLQYLPVD